MNDFERTNAEVSALQVAREYGADFDRYGKKARCIYHGPDKHPSMTFKDGRFRCWACGAHGSAIDYTMQLFGLDALGALKKLNEDFRLGLDLGARPDPDELRERKRTQEARKLFDEWREGMLNQFDACIRTANTADFTSLSDAAALALKWKATLEYWAEVLLHGNLDNQMQIFRDREGVTRLCKMILQNTPTKSTAA